MLVLSRKKGEGVVLSVGDVTIKVVVLAAKNSRVQLGFEAPQSVQIWRTEVEAELAAGEADVQTGRLIAHEEVKKELMPNDHEHGDAN